MKTIVLPSEFNAATHFVDRHMLEGRGHKIAIECGDQQVTYAQLFERVNRFGNVLKRLSVRPEERVALLLLDTPEFFYGFFGGIKIGAVPIPLNTLLKPAEYQYILNDCRARVADGIGEVEAPIGPAAGTALPRREHGPRDARRFERTGPQHARLLAHARRSRTTALA